MAASLSRSNLFAKLRCPSRLSNLTTKSQLPVNTPNCRNLFHASFKPQQSWKWRFGVGAAVLSSVFAGGLFKKIHAASEARPISRHVPGVIDIGPQKMTLYQFQSCPYCCKVRAALDYFGFEYDVVEVNSITKSQIKFSEYKKVPILVVDGTVCGEDFTFQFNDSSVVLSLLATYLFDQKEPLHKLQTYYPFVKETGRYNRIKWTFPNRYFVMHGESGDAKTEEDRNANSKVLQLEKKERDMRKWVDDVLMHTISPNVYHTMSESLEAFHHFSDWGQWEKEFSTLTRWLIVYAGAFVMYFVGRLVKKKYNIKDNPRDSLFEACDKWMEAVGDKPFYGGQQPNLADLSAYGALHSFQGCKAHNELMATHKVKDWYDRIEEQINSHRGATVLRQQSSNKSKDRSPRS